MVSREGTISCCECDFGPNPGSRPESEKQPVLNLPLQFVYESKTLGFFLCIPGGRGGEGRGKPYLRFERIW